MHKFIPVGNRAIGLRLDEDEVKTSSGFILTGSAAEKERNMRKAEVVSSNIDGLEPGDIVLYSKLFGTPYKEFIIFDEKDVWVKIVDDPAAD